MDDKDLPLETEIQHARLAAQEGCVGRGERGTGAIKEAMDAAEARVREERAGVTRTPPAGPQPFEDAPPQGPQPPTVPDPIP